MKVVLLAVALCVAGCSIGTGSAYVGQWRARNIVDFEACLENERGECTDRKQVVVHVPARKYWGFILSVPSVGASVVDHAGATTTSARFEASGELLRGFGRVAFGVRTGALYETSQGGMVSVAGIGHLSLNERLSVHVGLGATPYARLDGETRYLGGRGLVGLQLALSRAHSENHIVLTFEADGLIVALDETYRSTSLAAHIGIYF